MDGWISIHRKIKEHWIWQEKPFDKRSAWIDMLLMANHKDNKFLLGNGLVEVQRGSFITSEVKLADRWGWSRTKVRSFLDLLQNDNMLVKKSDNKKTTLTIVNYNDYQVSETAKEQQKDNKRTAKEQQKNTNNNDNNENNNIYKESQKINYQEIADLYNSICKSFPRLIKLSNARKKAIKARLKTYTIEDFKKLFIMAEESNFLKGKNDRNWSATFDWLIKDSNMAKVLDGNYKNSVSKPTKTKPNKFNNFPQREYTATDYKAIERALINKGLED